MKNAIENFKRFLERRYSGRSTTKHYMSDLLIFRAYVGDQPLRAITAKTIDGFVQSQNEAGLKAATINRRLSAIASFSTIAFVRRKTMVGLIQSIGNATACAKGATYRAM